MVGCCTIDMTLPKIFALFAILHLGNCNQYSSFGSVAIQQQASPVIESDRPHFPTGVQQQFPIALQQQREINVYGPQSDSGFLKPDYTQLFRQPALFADFARQGQFGGYGHRPYEFGHHHHHHGFGHRGLSPYFDYGRGCCRRRIGNCHRPLCDAPGFDYYDEVHHCCHRRVEGCQHRPVCAREFSFYDRERYCCRRRGRGCHRPRCGGHGRRRHHSRSRSNDRSRSHERSHSHSRSRSDEHRHRDNGRSHSNERRHDFGRYHDRSSRSNERRHHHDDRRHSSESHSRSNENVHRRKGDRPSPIRSNYPAFLPFFQLGNGTRQSVHQNVHVNVHQNSKCGPGTNCYKKS